MADLVSPIVDIISRLWTCSERHTRYLCKLQRNMDSLRNAMKELKDARNDVQRRVIKEEADPNESNKRTDSVSGWLQSVEKIEGEVDVILQEADDEQQLSRARCVGVCCPPNKCWSNYKLGKSITKKIPLVNELKVKGDFQELTYRLPPPHVQDVNLESTVGMESMFEKVWKHITSKDDKVSIIGLYGHGGVGKTTLLRKINNEFNKICGEHGFDHIVMFVVVSKPINHKAIQKKIGEKLGLSFQGDGDESSRADKIFNQLKNKNFVLLLDDIWERVDLQRIGIPSPTHAQGNSSKIIFTTRNKQVCGVMETTCKFQVECLPWEKAWSLFQEKVGEEALTCFPRARELAKDVAKQCGGLPLALITIGRAMSTTKSVEEWENAITTLRNSASEFPGMGDEVLPRLKLSYDNLHNETMKSCFLYCALYPEDHNIEITQLIDYWIGEGFLNGKLDEARSHGHHVIETLKRACLLESGLEDTFSWKSHVKMHDIIRDLALWIVNDCKSTTGKFLVASNVCERWRNAERIFWTNDDGDDGTKMNDKIFWTNDDGDDGTKMNDKIFWTNDDGDDGTKINDNIFWTNDVGINNGSEEPPPRSPNLQTLVVGLFRSEFSLPQSFFQFTPILRVLDLSHIYITELPTSICELHELQYLNLSNTYITELTAEFGKLVKLKFLDLSDTSVLEKIPPGVMANFSELQVLKLFGSGFKDWCLKEEEEEDGTGGLSLGELDRLKQLQEFTLNIFTSLALEELLCNQKLRRICTGLLLESCVNLNKSISLLPPSSSTTSQGLGNLISLKYLQIRDCVELEELVLWSINDDGETTTTNTSSAAGLLISNNNKLEQLLLDNLPRLNNIVCGEKYHLYMAAAQQQQHYLHYVSPFQNLYWICIQKCDALKELTWLVYVENLKVLLLSDCEELETIIDHLGDDDGLEGTSVGGGGGVFGRLRNLTMARLPRLKSICRHALAFPFIELIYVIDCPELKKLPLGYESNVNNTLKWIRGATEWWNQLEWEDETIKSKFLPYYKEPW